MKLRLWQEMEKFLSLQEVGCFKEGSKMIDHKSNKIKMKLNSNNSQERHTRTYTNTCTHICKVQHSVYSNVGIFYLSKQFFSCRLCISSTRNFKTYKFVGTQSRTTKFYLIGEKEEEPSIFLSFRDGSANHFHISIWQSPRCDLFLLRIISPIVLQFLVFKRLLY